MHLTQLDATPALTGGMSEAVRNHDWSRTALGPMHMWPSSLRIAVDMLLASKFPGCLVWGPELVTIPNDAFLPILGNKPKALGRGFDDVWSDVWDDIGSLVFRVLAGEPIFIENFPLITSRNGVDEQAYFTFCYSPVRDESGAIAGFLDTVFETTASVESQEQWRTLAKTYEQQAQASIEDRQLFWQLSSDVVVMVTPELDVLSLNPACQQVLGWHDGMLGKSVLEFVHPDDVADVLESLAPLQTGQVVQGNESRLRHVDGHYRWFSWAALPGEGFITGVGRDITLERERQEALRQAEELLRHNQKMEAVGQLTGGVAHDFNNLLTGISGSLEMLQRRIAQGRMDDLNKYIEAARIGTQRAATLTHRLLAFARRQPLSPKHTDLNELTHGVVPLIEQMLGPDVALHLQLDPQPWSVLVDAGQLENAVLNLCINARDAMPGGGRLSIRTGNQRLAPELHGEDGLQQGDYSFIEVQDDGCGMSAEVVSRAFDPFFTTKPPGQGTGLGLSMVYGFARQSGGRAWIDSQAGSGTRVKLLLPRHDGARPEPAPVEQDSPVIEPVSGKRVLLIDDEATLRMLMCEALVEQGYEVIEAPDAKAGLAAYTRVGRIDMLVTDIGLPGGVSGRQVVSALRQQQADLPVLYITGYTESVLNRGPALEVGAELLAKPFSLDALVAKVGSLLQPESPVAPEVVPAR